MRVRLTGSFVLAGRLDAVLPLFTAEGERRWAPGREPVWANELHEHEIGEVWTAAGPPSTSWVTVDAGVDHVGYARVALGDSAGLVTVICAENGGRTTVTVDDDLSALSDAGADRLGHFAESYNEMLAHWQHHASRALVTNEPASGAACRWVLPVCRNGYAIRQLRGSIRRLDVPGCTHDDARDSSVTLGRLQRA